MVKTETKHSDAEQLVRSKLDELIQFRSQTDDIKEFWGKQFDLGLAWVQFPEGAGGLGLTVYIALGRLDVGSAVIGGTGIVILAIILDRITQKIIKSH